MKATMGENVSNAVNYKGQKELVKSYNVITDTLREIIIARCYMGRSANASTVYASVWINTSEVHTSGKGKAGGYGYHKVSAAIGDAINSAGIALDTDISGVGNSAILDALTAIANALGFERVLIVEN